MYIHTYIHIDTNVFTFNHVGRIEQGCIKTGEEIEIAGIKGTTKTTCIGVRESERERDWL